MPPDLLASQHQLPQQPRKKLIIGDSMIRGIPNWKNTVLEAHSGATIQDILHIYTDRREFLQQYQVIAFLIGTNNIGQGQSLTDIQQAFNDLHLFMSRLTPVPTIIICGILPRPCDASPLVKEINLWLQMWSGTQGLIFLRAFSPFRTGDAIKTELYGSKQLHLNQRGKQALLNFLQSQLGERNLTKRRDMLRSMPLD